VFGKCVLVILAVGTIGCALLALRQSRLQAASEMVRIQLDIRNQDEELWLLRTQIAQQITPDQIRQMMADIGPLKPLNSSEISSPANAQGEPTTVPASGAAPAPASPAQPTRDPKARPTNPPTNPTMSPPTAPRTPAAASLDRRFATQQDRPREFAKSPAKDDQ